MILWIDSRRTTATTLASIQAVAQDLSRQRNGTDDATAKNGTIAEDGRDVSRVLKSAMSAAHRAGMLVDNMEMVESSQELERR